MFVHVWVRKDSDEGNLSGVKFSIVAANNHYAGFAPGTVNIFRQLLGLKEVKWGDEFIATDNLEKDVDVSTNKHVIKNKQTSLSDFMSSVVSENFKMKCIFEIQ